jgi:hypothetical protein
MALNFLNNGYFAGSVGIGTESPNEKLEVNGAVAIGNATDGIKLRLTGTVGEILGLSTTSGSWNDLDIRTQAATQLYLKTDGNVGIGTTSPSDTLTVIGDVRVTGVLKLASGSAGAPSLAHRSDENTGLFFPANDNIGFTTSNTERMRINSVGAVLINATAVRESASKLSVQGGMSEFETTLTNGNDWANSPISILERGNIGSGSADDKYSPNLNFHWSGRVSNSLWMSDDGQLNWGSYTSAGIPAVDGRINAATFYGDHLGTINTATTGTTQTVGNNSTLIATTAYADAAAAAVPIGNYLPLAGGIMTGTTGVTMPDSFPLFLGSSGINDSQIFWDGDNIEIQARKANADIVFRAANSSSVLGEFLAIDGGIGKTRAYKDIHFQNNVKASFGDATTPALEIYHTGSGSIIKDAGTGNLEILADSLSLLNAAGSEYYARFYTNGAAYLYHDGVAKLNTMTTGLAIGPAPASTNLELNLNGVANKAIRIQFQESGTNRWLLGQGAASENSNFELYNSAGVITISANRSTNAVTFAGNVTAPTFIGNVTGNLTGIVTATSSLADGVTGTTQGDSDDSELIATTAFVQNLIETIPAGLVFQGTWNASTNTPTLTSGSGTTGNFYIVSVDGSTNLDGITDWKVGDWAVFIEQGASDQWEKIDNSSVLDGIGTGNNISKWAGSGTSNTLTNSLLTDTGTLGYITSNGELFQLQGTTASGYAEIDIGNDLNDKLVIGSIGSTFSSADWAGSTYLYNSGTGKKMYIKSQDNMQFFTGGTALAQIRMTILSGGNVGIGTTSPTGKLQIEGADDTSLLHLSLSGGYSKGSLEIDDPYFVVKSTSNTTGGIKFRTITGGTTYDRMTILNSGNVGIGTTNPAQNFVVAEGTNQHGIELVPGTLSYIQAYDRATSDYGNLKIDAEYIAFGTGNGSERMRIFADGDVSIGMTANYAMLNVNGNIRAENANILVTRGAASDPSHTFHDDADTGMFNVASNILCFSTAERMRINAAGAIQFNAYDSTNQTGTPTYLLGTDDSGNIVKTNTVPGSAAGPYLPLTGGTLSSTNSNILILNPTANNYGGILFQYGGTTKGTSIYNSGGMVYGGESGNFTRLQAGGQYGLHLDPTNRNVHIGGTTDATYKLQVTGTSYVSGNGTFGGNVGVAGKTPTHGLTLAQGTGVGSKIVWSDSTPDFAASIYASNSTDKLTFATKNASNVETTALEIDTSQNATFAGDVYVAEATNKGQLFFGTANTDYEIKGGGNYGYLSLNAPILRFDTGGTERMRIKSNGQVNISQKPNSGLAYDVLINVGTSPDGLIGYQTVDQLAVNLGASTSSNWVKSGNDIYNTNSANVGIGTTTPQKKVHIEGTGGASEMQILVSSASDTVGHTAGIGLRGEGGEADGDLRIKGGIFFERIAGSFGNGKMILAVNSSVSNTSVTVADHALTIDTNKNVGIGITGPQSKLQVAGGIQMADDTDTAVVGKVGTLRYRTSGNNSYVDMCMQTAASTYAWINIVQNNW